MAYRILQDGHTKSVLLFGRGSLARQLQELLETAQFRVRLQTKGELDAEFLNRDATAEILVVNRLAHTTRLAPLLAKRIPSYLTVSTLDTRGLIAPARNNYRGPCLMRVDLQRTNVDKRWHTLVTQQPNGPTNPDPVVEAATAARVVAILKTSPLRSGEFEEIDPYAGKITRSTVPTDPRCPICWHQKG